MIFQTSMAGDQGGGRRGSPADDESRRHAWTVALERDWAREDFGQHQYQRESVRPSFFIKINALTACAKRTRLDFAIQLGQSRLATKNDSEMLVVHKTCDKQETSLFSKRVWLGTKEAAGGEPRG